VLDPLYEGLFDVIDAARQSPVLPFSRAATASTDRNSPSLHLSF